jgi:hypothetical protein
MPQGSFRQSKESSKIVSSHGATQSVITARLAGRSAQPAAIATVAVSHGLFAPNRLCHRPRSVAGKPRCDALSGTVMDCEQVTSPKRQLRRLDFLRCRISPSPSQGVSGCVVDLMCHIECGFPKRNRSRAEWLFRSKSDAQDMRPQPAKSAAGAALLPAAKQPNAIRFRAREISHTLRQTVLTALAKSHSIDGRSTV